MSNNLTIGTIEYKRHWDILEADEFKAITHKNFEDKRRWVTTVSQVVQHVPTERFFEITWEEANSESSEGSEAEGYWWQEVEPKVVSKTVYVPLERKE